MITLARTRAPRIATEREERLAAELARVDAPIPVALPQRLADAVREFRWVDARGLTAQEAADRIGPRWRSVITQLRDRGFVFSEYRSKYRPDRTFRWVLDAEPNPGSEEELGF